MARTVSRFQFAFAIAMLASQSGCERSGPTSATAPAMESIRLIMDTPAAGWSAAPVEAWETDETIYCVFQLTPPKGMAAQVITTIESGLKLPASPKPKKIVALGKTWNWNPSPSIEFPKSLDAFKATLPDNAKRIETQPLDPAGSQSTHVFPDAQHRYVSRNA